MPISCYSVHLVIPEADAERRLALASLEAMLVRLRCCPASLSWFNDSGDGATSPDQA